MTLASYNYTAMAQYLEGYWSNYNPAYRSFAGGGGDCTNFVSQALYAGGTLRTMLIGPDVRVAWRTLSLTLLVTVVGCSNPPPSEEQVTIFARQYVDAINAGEAGKLSKLLNNPAQPNDAVDRLAEASGGPWALTDTKTAELSPNYFKATLDVRSAQSRRVWSLSLGLVDGRFVVGPLKSSGETGASTASPSR